jgi:hypothetical protein
MSNRRVSDYPISIRLGLRFYIQYGGFGEDVNAVVNSMYKNPNFLEELSSAILERDIDAVLALLDNEEPYETAADRDLVIGLIGTTRTVN